MMKRIPAILLALALLLSLGVGALSAQAEEPSPGQTRKAASANQQTISTSATAPSISNGYLEFVVNTDTDSGESGRFTIGTTGGNPEITTDDNVKLLYGHPEPWSSYTTFRVDGTNYIYGESGFTTAPTSNSSTLSNTSVAACGAVSVRQTLTLVMNTSTNRRDVVEIKYDVTNNDRAAHTVGTRIMLDIMVDGNDHAPFWISDGIGQTSTQMEFSGNSIPQFWQAYDSLTNTRAIGHGSFFRSGSNPPNKVQFTYWRQVYDSAWNTPIVAGAANGDSAVTVTWNENSLPAGQTRTYVTHYGLSEFLSDLNPPLALSIYSDNTVGVVSGAYNPNPIDAVAYIKNIGNTPAVNAYALIVPNTGLSLTGTTPARVELGSLAVGEQTMVSWKLLIASVTSDTSRSYKIIVGADGLVDKELSKTILVPALNNNTESCWEKLPVWLVWILRYILFGWLWMN